MSLLVRLANISDIEWLKSELKKFDEFSGSKLPLSGGSDEHKNNLLTNLITNHVLLVCDKLTESTGLGDPAGMPVGLICGMFHRHAFNPEIKVLTEYFWWVQPEYRNTRAGLLLFNEFDRIGKESGCDWVTFSLLPNSPVKKEFLEKKGYNLSEYAFLKENLKEVANG